MVFHVLLAGVATALLAVLCVEPAELWLLEHHTWPHGLAVPFVLLYLAIAFRVPGRAGDMLLAAVLGGMYATFTVFPLGDHMRWTVVATTNNLFRSEILANLLFRSIHVAAGPESLRFIAPAFGVLAALAYLTVCRALFGAAVGVQRLVRCYYLASAVQLVFFSNYIENTQIATPFLLLYMLLLCRHVSAPQRRGSLVPAALALGVTCLVHGQNLFLTPSLPMAIVLAGWHHRTRGAIARDALVATGLAALVVVATALAFRGAGLLVEGHERMPFPPSNTFGVDRLGWFSLPHWVELGNIALLASPVTFAAPLLAALFLGRRREESTDLLWPVSILALGYFSFVFLWSFDFGFPMDYDLMLSMSMPWNLALLGWLLAVAQRSTRLRKMAWALVLVGGAATWAVLWSFADHYDPHARGASSPRLVVNSQKAQDDAAPVLLGLTPEDEGLLVELTGRPGAGFYLLAGPRAQPGNFVSATVGTLDIGTPPRFHDISWPPLDRGELDETGRWRRTFPLPTEPINIQALFWEEPGSRYLSQLTAAFYVTPP